MKVSFISYRQKEKTSKRGSFLADVLVSLFVLMTSLSIGYSVLSTALIAHSYNKNKIIAINIAREGMESIRLMRDTNWLKYGEKRRLCWNFWDNTDENNEWNNTSDRSCDEGSDSGQNDHPIGFADIDSDGLGDLRIKNFISVLDPINYNWTLVENFYQIDEVPKELLSDNLPTWNVPDLTNGDSQANWDTRRVNVNGLTSQLFIDDTTGLYTHNPFQSDAVTPNIPTKFYREIIIEYPSNTISGEEGFYPIGQPLYDNQISVTVKVWYPRSGGYWSSVVMETELTDHFGRTNWLE